MTGVISRPLNDAGIAYEEYIYSLLIDHSQRLWVGAINGLILVDVKTKKKLEASFLMDGVVEKFSNVARLHEDQQGRVWIGADGGLYKVIGIEEKNNVLEVNIENWIHQISTELR